MDRTRSAAGRLLHQAPAEAWLRFIEEDRERKPSTLKDYRSVLSDEDVSEIADPIRQRWRQVQNEELAAALKYAEACPEFRFRREPEGGLTLFILAARGAPDELLGLKVAGLLVEVLEPIHGVVTVDQSKRAYRSLTKADQLSTEQIDLEWASYEEGEEMGVLPAA